MRKTQKGAPGVRLPGLLSLQAFEATARLGSVSRAAEELSLTQSAVSRQILMLEARLGLRLFSRVKQRLILSDAGGAYLPDVRAGLAALRGATDGLVSSQGRSGTLRLATLPTFGARWLIPRLGRFRDKYPGATLELITRLAPFDFSIEQLDGAIHFGGPDWPGATSELLAREELLAVASPRLASACKSPADVLKQPLIQITTRAFAWHEWLAAAGLPGRPHNPTLQVETFAMGIEAARAEFGVAILPRLFIHDELASGELVAVGEVVPSQSAYYFVYPHHKRNDYLVRGFSDWLAREKTSDGD
jgi:LysR family glycine cleavage system transcriptional activator